MIDIDKLEAKYVNDATIAARNRNTDRMLAICDVLRLIREVRGLRRLQDEAKVIHEECADMLKVCKTPEERAVVEACAVRVGKRLLPYLQEAEESQHDPPIG